VIEKPTRWDTPTPSKGQGASVAQTVSHTHALMCAGTGSHVGKSVLVAGLCRIYSRRGLRVAPFKAQNMALNSYVTRDGGEIGRAQAYQAHAAGAEPQVEMNPVLLKPSSQTGSQVIVLGRPVGNMSVSEYHAYQSQVWPEVVAAYRRLSAAHDLVIIEGAGSAAEINLRQHDIVNLKVARLANSPVLLIGDIDRGGVFASLVGHMELFTPEERQLIAAFVINKFRGDATLLRSGIEYLRKRTGVPTLGVVPMLTDWHAEEEDSLGVESRQSEDKASAPVQVAVVRFPYMSNYTDFDTLADEADVNVRYVTNAAEFRGVAAIILPGTKSTVADLRWLRETGLAAELLAQASSGTPVVGICGGYQMLGRRIYDPAHIETDADVVNGLALLDTETTFFSEKRTVQVEGHLLSGASSNCPGLGMGSAGPLGPPGTPVRGYEIHMGRTRLGRSAVPLARLHDADGSTHDDGAVAATCGRFTRATGRLNVCGTYVHGIFDHPATREAFLNQLRQRIGLPPRRVTALSGETALDRLADHIQAHLDMELLDDIVGLR